VSRILGVDSKGDVSLPANPNLSSPFKHWGKSYAFKISLCVSFWPSSAETGSAVYKILLPVVEQEFDTFKANLAILISINCAYRVDW
jgi:hypothetical protein